MAASGRSLTTVRPAATKIFYKFQIVSQGKESLLGPPIKYQYLLHNVSQGSKNKQKNTHLIHLLYAPVAFASTGTIFQVHRVPPCDDDAKELANVRLSYYKFEHFLLPQNVARVYVPNSEIRFACCKYLVPNFRCAFTSRDDDNARCTKAKVNFVFFPAVQQAFSKYIHLKRPHVNQNPACCGGGRKHFFFPAWFARRVKNKNGHEKNNTPTPLHSLRFISFLRVENKKKKKKRPRNNSDHLCTPIHA